MKFHNMQYRLRPLAAAIVLAATACSQDRVNMAPVETAAAVKVNLEASSLSAATGERIAVAIRAESPGADLSGLQGTLRFDAARLRYAGQAESRAIVAVNSGDAARGELRIASVSAEGLAPRTAVLVFDVLGGGYASSLRYDVAVAADLGAEELSATAERHAAIAADLSLPVEFGWYSVRQWAARHHADLLAAETAEVPAGLQQSPGSYLLNLRFGDVTLNGAINVLDAADAANLTVGNNELIIGTAAPNRDRVMAANVRPANLPGLGEAGDALPPGVSGTGARDINVLDAAAIANESVGNPSDITGELMPGRGALPGAGARVVIASDITADRLLSRDTVYELAGVIKVNNGATLTIQPGTRIEGQVPPVSSALFVERNGRIIADGTALEPIVMTCTGAKVPGCWGGLWIAGNAGINTGTADSPANPGRDGGLTNCLQNVGEGGATSYGGCNNADSSGVLRYLVVEYCGKIVSGNNELNCLTMGGVGSGTVVDFIQAHAGLDDGIELFGGTVNVRHAYMTANSDDSFDYALGWSGTAQFLIIHHDTTDADKGFEVDNTETAATYDTGVPLTTGRVFNVTFVGEAVVNGTVNANTSMDALHLRRGTSTQIRNMLTINANRVLDLDDAETCTAPDIVVASSLFAGSGRLDAADTGDPVCSGAVNESDYLQLAANANQVVASSAGILKSPFDYDLPDYRPSATLPAGVSLVGATPPAGFDVTATFIGALPQSNSTGTNIPWYSGWSRSARR